MGTLPEPSNEQKLSYIYQVMKDQESRRKRKAVMSFLKFILFIAIISYLYIYRIQIIDIAYKYASSFVNERVKQISEEQKSGILKGIQQLLPPSLENTLKDVQKIILTGSGDISTPSEQSSTTKTTTTTKKPVKK